MTTTMVRNRVEAIIPDVAGNGYWVERLLSTEHPENIGKLRCIGGKVEEGETPCMALIRELEEEYGMLVAPNQLMLTAQLDGPRGALTRYTIFKGRAKPGFSNTNNEEMVLSETIPDPWF